MVQQRNIRTAIVLKNFLISVMKRTGSLTVKKLSMVHSPVINYLGKYTHRIAISNHRIKSMTDTTVTYVVKDYKNEGCWKEKTISGEEFIRRFMMHVPPKRFVRIRHYGLLSCRNKRKKITHCRNLLGCKKYISTLKNLNAVEMIRVLYHIDVCKCSSCGGNMVSPRKDKYSSSFRAHMRC